MPPQLRHPSHPKGRLQSSSSESNDQGEGLTWNVRRYGAKAAIDGEGVIGFVENEDVVVINERQAVNGPLLLRRYAWLCNLPSSQHVDQPPYAGRVFAESRLRRDLKKEDVGS